VTRLRARSTERGETAPTAAAWLGVTPYASIIRQPKHTVKASRMVAIEGECYEVRDPEGLLATDPSKPVVLYRLDGNTRTEIGRLSVAMPPNGVPAGENAALIVAIVTKWFVR
jgi:hypothetical protein